MQMQFGQYIPNNTFVHRLDPRTKIISTLFLMSSIFIKPHYIIFTVMTLFLMSLIKLSQISFKNIIRGVKPLIWMFFFLFIINIFVIKEGKVLFTIPWFNKEVYSKAIFQTIFIFWRVILIVVMSIILTTTTNPLTLTLGLEKLSAPLKKIKVPVEVFAMMISIALRFIPTIFEEVSKISNAQASRGLDFQNGKFKVKIKAIIALVIPLLVSSFNKADDLALSMESKNYNPTVQRPRYRTLKANKVDVIATLLVMTWLIFIILIKINLIKVLGI